MEGNGSKLFPGKKIASVQLQRKWRRIKIEGRLALDSMRLQERERKEKQRIKGDHRSLFNSIYIIYYKIFLLSKFWTKYIPDLDNLFTIFFFFGYLFTK